MDFVRQSECLPRFLTASCTADSRYPANRSTALSLAMSRDGSSGGTIRMAVITKEGVERVFVPGDKLPNYNDRVE